MIDILESLDNSFPDTTSKGNSILIFFFLALSNIDFAIFIIFFSIKLFPTFISLAFKKVNAIAPPIRICDALSKKFSEAEKRNYVIDVINKRKLELQQLESLEKHLKEKQEIEEKIHKLDAQKKALRSEMNDLDADKKNLISKANELKTT